MSKIQAEIDRLTLVINEWTAAARAAAIAKRHARQKITNPTERVAVAAALKSGKKKGYLDGSDGTPETQRHASRLSFAVDGRVRARKKADRAAARAAKGPAAKKAPKPFKPESIARGKENVKRLTERGLSKKATRSVMEDMHQEIPLKRFDEFMKALKK